MPTHTDLDTAAAQSEGDAHWLVQALTAARRELAQEREARRRAEEAAAAKDEFLAVVAHELRGPLGAILGWAHLLHEKGGDDETRQGLEVIEQSVQVQAQLIEDLLDVSRLAGGRVRLDLQPLDPAAVVEAAVAAIRPSADSKAVRLAMDCEEGLPPIAGDATRLQQVLCNLLTNAVKFTPQGGDVDVTLRRDGSHAVVRVRDTGVGIAPHFLAHVFDRFRQSPEAREQGGLGLGLAIARHLVELHGGRIAARSEGEGRGATFTVQLPLAAAA